MRDKCVSRTFGTTLKVRDSSSYYCYGFRIIRPEQARHKSMTESTSLEVNSGIIAYLKKYWLRLIIQPAIITSKELIRMRGNMEIRIPEWAKKCLYDDTSTMEGQTFETLKPDENNSDAIIAAQSLLQHKADRIIIWGKTGCGKTHLLRAI